MPTARSLQLLALGTATGIFSGLFGVGGGTVLVPGLVLFLGYGEREATGTSLAAIVVIATAGAATQALYGNLNVGHAALLGIPAVAGVLLGTRLQQRVHTDVISYLFAALLVVVAADLVIR